MSPASVSASHVVKSITSVSVSCCDSDGMSTTSLPALAFAPPRARSPPPSSFPSFPFRAPPPLALHVATECACFALPPSPSASGADEAEGATPGRAAAAAAGLARWLSAPTLSLFSGEPQVVEASDASDAVLGDDGRQLPPPAPPPCPCPPGCVSACGCVCARGCVCVCVCGGVSVCGCVFVFEGSWVAGVDVGALA